MVKGKNGRKWQAQWEIESFSEPGKYYTVSQALDLEHWECDCPAWRFSGKRNGGVRQDCKHITLVQRTHNKSAAVNNKPAQTVTLPNRPGVKFAPEIQADGFRIRRRILEDVEVNAEDVLRPAQRRSLNLDDSTSVPTTELKRNTRIVQTEQAGQQAPEDIFAELTQALTCMLETDPVRVIRLTEAYAGELQVIGRKATARTERAKVPASAPTKTTQKQTVRR